MLTYFLKKYILKLEVQHFCEMLFIVESKKKKKINNYAVKYNFILRYLYISKNFQNMQQYAQQIFILNFFDYDKNCLLI